MARSVVMALVVASGLAAAPVLAQQEVRYAATELTPGLYMLAGEGGFAGGNIGLLTGEDGTILIDDGVLPLTDALLAAIAEITDDDVDFLINTHVHGDHVGNNAHFGAGGATIVTHDNIRRRLVEIGIDFGNGPEPTPPAALPVVTFSDAVTFHLDGHQARVFHVARAHTDGDALIHFRTVDVIHAGDILFNGLFPFIDMDTGGTLEGYIAAQELLLEMAGEETRIIAGHGPLATRGDVAAALAMIKDCRDRIQALIDQGMDLDAILAANPLADYHDDWNWGFITTERMTRQMHRALTSGGD